jgi:hypothetical protein
MSMAEFKPTGRNLIVGMFATLYSGVQVLFTAYNAYQKSAGPTRLDIFIIVGFRPLTILGVETILRILKNWRIQKEPGLPNDDA